MRQFKFRVWGANKMAYQSDGVCISFGKGYVEAEAFTPKGVSLWIMSEPMVVMQFTGLLDKNGKEIYEGDVIKINGGAEDVLGQVVFEDGCFCIVPSWIQDGFHPELKNYTNMVFCETKIIGNIYEKYDPGC